MRAEESESEFLQGFQPESEGTLIASTIDKERLREREMCLRHECSFGCVYPAQQWWFCVVDGGGGGGGITGYSVCRSFPTVDILALSYCHSVVVVLETGQGGHSSLPRAVTHRTSLPLPCPPVLHHHPYPTPYCLPSCTYSRIDIRLQKSHPKPISHRHSHSHREGGGGGDFTIRSRR